MKTNSWLPPIVIILFANLAHAQETYSTLLRADPILAELDSILHSSDSLSILSLIDSLLAMPQEKSQLAVRFGYNSNVASAGRTLNVSKFGLSPALSYYHKSGAYSDLAAYWSKEYETELYLTILSAGYIATITRNWSVIGEYGHYFYTPVKNATTSPDSALVETPYTNNIYISNFLDAGKFTFRVDYSLLFGSKTAHRISPVIGLNFTKKKWKGLDRMTWFPSANLMYGDGTAFEYYQIRLRPPQFLEVEKKVWGIMNYALSSLVTVSVKNWSFLVNYTYNFPQSLPGEDQGLTHGGYAAVSITRYFNF